MSCQNHQGCGDKGAGVGKVMAQLPREVVESLTVPGGAQDMWRCGTETCGQWPWWGWVGVGRGDLSGLYKP